ncbi:hypothetical protein FE772_08390 [Lysobacter enzymogenes]|nr:hypothetical protein [Lysobacter enzymogenes]QCW25682.1 hypothetical protein FE772_08390 [Lysobacter enzymogenes]
MKSWGKGRALPWLGLLFVLCASAKAQEAPSAEPAQGNCPLLPASTGLHWEYRGTADSDFCRALREDGSEAFGLYIADKSPFQPRRGDRVEEATIDGKQIHWYRSQIAGKPDVQARETLIEVGNGKLAHIWVQAQSADQLKEALGQTEGLRFQSARLSRK